ncbi:Aste57867_7729 [Aphanomyces stellatus]|uniref:Aste57867_7729 protein n=1 Tax=Aphanomyces stellatus TaxID=120398 RepID=A0A485KIQ4_9STRA|nr:hypothetical protein As57867_007700 [Aphanomyces stellatus]VFT84630.1 Aste57867_7729 [Aphanomyces stellatus]
MYSFHNFLCSVTVQAAAKQQVHNEKILRKELFQWDLALSAEQALQRISKLAKSAAINGVVPSYNLMLLCDDVLIARVRGSKRWL